MILSNIEIHRALDEKRLIIEPEPQPRIPTLGQECPYDSHSVNLKLHEEILKPKSGKFSIDLTQPGSLAQLITEHSEKYIISKKQPYMLAPGEFVLARTLEKIDLPIIGNPPYLAARIEGKSSRARLGLIVHCTAPTVHPGFTGTLTLEMANLGPATISLIPEMYIAQLILEQVKGEILLNPSQFQDQSDPSGITSSSV
ncbi:MAG: dCTP deaminase [Sedimentisphaerales bacterium]|nr:dCTP deaminase [Sedimentisphaerales bacterium]